MHSLIYLYLVTYSCIDIVQWGICSQLQTTKSKQVATHSPRKHFISLRFWATNLHLGGLNDLFESWAYLRALKVMSSSSGGQWQHWYEADCLR